MTLALCTCAEFSANRDPVERPPNDRAQFMHYVKHGPVTRLHRLEVMSVLSGAHSSLNGAYEAIIILNVNNDFYPSLSCTIF